VSVVPILPLAELADRLAPGRPLLGLDFGTKTLGVALSDVSRTVATPMTVIRRGRLAADLDRLAALLAEFEAGGIIIGLPVSMDGGEGPACQRVRQFARDLAARVALPVALWDERLSTAAVERMLIREADLSRDRRRRVIDRAAAAFILQGALDALANLGRDRAQPLGRDSGRQP
jgi:putative Holliday junction resolvase